MADLARRRQSRKNKRTKGETREFFSRKMAWLTKQCASPDVTDSEFRYLFALAVRWLFNRDDYCAPSDEQLGESVGKTGGGAQKATWRLHAKGIIIKTKQMRTSFYDFVGLTDQTGSLNTDQTTQRSDQTMEQSDQTMEQSDQTGVSDLYNPSTLPSTLPSTHICEREDSDSQKDSERVPSTSLVLYSAGLQITPKGEAEIAFERFWDAYPYRTDKPAARAAWAVAITKAPADLIIDRAAATMPSGEHWRKPSTWLNAEGWCDGPPPSRFLQEGEQLCDRAAAKDAEPEPLLKEPGRFASAIEKFQYAEQQKRLAAAGLPPPKKGTA